MASVRLMTGCPKFLQSLGVRHRHDHAQHTYAGEQKYKYQSPADHPFQQMFPWRSLEQFTKRIEDSILYQDDKIVAIEKPWGVGIHRPHPTIKKQTEYLMEALSFGDPRFCIDDALPFLQDNMRVKNLRTVRPLDRFESGIVLLAKDEDGERAIAKSWKRAKTLAKPHLKYWCITKGYPVIEGNIVSEKVCLKKIDADELAEYKEPIVVSEKSFSKRFVQIHQQDFTRGQVDLHVLDSNKTLAVSLMEIATTNMKFSFVRCYAASKTSFVIGDTRFAKRVRHVLGVPFTLQPGGIPANDSYEPLPWPLRKKLLVAQNSEVPLLMHLRAINLHSYLPKKQDLIISSSKLPHHFEWALNRLNLGRNLSRQMASKGEEEASDGW